MLNRFAVILSIFGKYFRISSLETQLDFSANSLRW